MNKNKLKLFASILILAMSVVLIALSILVHFRSILGTDVFLSKDLQGGGNTPEKRTLIYHGLYLVSLFGKPIISSVMVAIAALFFWFYKYYRETIYVIITPLSALVDVLVKMAVNRPRPSGDLVNILAVETDKSFPSGHVNFYTVFFGFLFVVLFYTPKIAKPIRIGIQVICLFLIITVSFSRVYLGVHWVTDTIGGYLLGLILLCLLLYFYLRPKYPVKS